MLKSSTLVIAAAAGAALAAATAYPVPTPPQLAWQKGEIMALIHFNMATFFKNGDPGCDASNWAGPSGSSNPASFAPSQLNISNWVESMQALGINEAVLTAKHGCGFYLWQTNITLPDGTRYPYRVVEAQYGDVLRTFVDTLAAAGIGHGFYYSLTNNFFLNVAGNQVQPGPLLPGQASVNQSQFEDIATASLAELWSRFGNLTELWLDGGYFSMADRLQPLLMKYQPQAVVFGGAGLSPNPVRWCGTEGGDPPGWPDIWSTDCGSGSGNGCRPDSAGAVWNPSAVDFTLQQGDTWFYEPGAAVHPLSDLVGVYHRSVGANGRLELDFAIDRTGRVDPVHAAAYKGLGDWIRACYGTPVAQVRPAPGASVITVPVPVNASSGQASVIDRLMMQEDQTGGQVITSYYTEYQGTDGQWRPFSSGSPIGNKRIDLGSAPVSATAVRLTVNGTLPGATPVLSNIAVFAPGPCAIPSNNVKFTYGGQCLISNATFPCPGGAGNSCPVFLGPCSDPSAVWDDSTGVLQNVHWAPAAINIDCDASAPGTVAKLLDAGGANPIAFSPAGGGQMVYTAPGGARMCLNGGQGPVKPPCNPAEQYATDQISLVDCSTAQAQGWSRVPA